MAIKTSFARMNARLLRPRARSIFATLGLIVAVAFLHGCAGLTPGASQDDPQLRAQLTARAHSWDAAIVRKDRVAIEANMADDFRQIDGYGNVYDKAAFVRELVDPALTINPYTVENFDLRFYGSVALLSGTTRMTGRFAGKPFKSHYRYIDIYARRDGAWKIVSVQISKFSK